MAALLLRRASTLATRSASYSLIPFAVVRPGSSSYVHNRPFASLIPPSSSGSAVCHANLIKSMLENSAPFPEFGDPCLPIPDDFPFIILQHPRSLGLTRLDKDEKIEVEVDWKSGPLVINGNPCFHMYTTILRGHCELKLVIIGGPKTLIIKSVKMSYVGKHKIECFEDCLESSGINKGLIRSLFRLFGKKKD